MSYMIALKDLECCRSIYVDKSLGLSSEALNSSLKNVSYFWGIFTRIIQPG